MVSIYSIRIFFLVATFGISITQLYSDTNTQSLSPSKADAIMACEQRVEALIDILLGAHSAKGPQLIDLLNPIWNICNQLRKVPTDLPTIEYYRMLTLLNQSTAFLVKVHEKSLDEINDFSPDMPLKETATDQEFDELLDKFIKASDSARTKIEEIFQDMQATLLMHVREQLIKLDTILQTINTNLSINQNIINKNDIKDEIMALRNTLNLIRKNVSGSTASIDTIMSLHQVNKAVIAYLQDAQKHKFRKWSLIDLPSIFMRSKETPQSVEELTAGIMQSNADLVTLEKAAEKIDLTVVNKTARFFGDYIVDPINKYDLGLYGLTAVSTAGLAAYFAYFFDQTFAKDPHTWLRRMIGYPDHFSGSLIPDPKSVIGAMTNLPPEVIGELLEKTLKQLINNPPTTREEHIDWLKAKKINETLLNYINSNITQPKVPLARMDEFMFKHKTGALATGVTLIGLAVFCYYKIWQKNSPFWSKKIHYWFEHLKGGSFAKMADKYDFVYPTTTLDDVIGLEHEKQQIYPILKYIKDPERWDANELSPVTGILLTGPTRSGKTFFAKAICGELHKQNPEKNIRFLSIDAHDIKVESIFSWLNMAKLFAPCVLFIDEIDLLGLQRNQDKTLLADFLQALSGIADKDPKKQVIVIGTTNKPENIDHALIQSGRLALQIRFQYPNLKERKEFIRKRLDKFAITPEAFDIDVDKLALETHEKSFEDIKLMIDSALINVGIKGDILSQNILEWALDTQLRKIIDVDQKAIAEDEKRMLAAHFAGQALTQILLNMDEKVAKITIRQIVAKVKEESVYEQFYSQTKQTGLEQGAIFTYLDHDTFDIKSQEEIANKAKTLLGARIAEKIITASCSAFFGWKKNAAFNMIKSIVADGIDLKSLSKNGQNAISDQAQECLRKYEQEVEQLLLTHKDALLAITNALEQKQTLTTDQMMALITEVEGKAGAALVYDELETAIPAAA